MLEAVELTKQFKQMKAVNRVNLYLEQGEIVGLLGPNGAGKSTTISMLSTLIPPSSGDVRFHQKSILKNPAMLRNVLGIVPQEIALYSDLSAKENLWFFGRIHRLSGVQLQKKVEEILELIGLTDRQNDLVKHFSGGMKRRLNIGAALLHEPKLLIMDEPTVGIDPQSRNYILETVKRLNEEKQMTVLYTSHYMEEVEFLCNRIYIMDKGCIIASGTTAEIKNILSAEHTVEIKVEKLNESFLHALRTQPVVRHIAIQDRVITMLSPKEVNVFRLLFQLAEQTDTVLTSIEMKTPTLEDVFLHLTGRALRD